MCSKKCKECGKILDNKINIFCDKKCAAIYNNKIYPKKKKKIKYCKNCGKLLENNINIYCNKDCYHEFIFKNKTLPKYYNGEICDNNVLRKILFYFNGVNCFECNNSNIWNGKPLTLEVDHIDGNSDNNKPDNLRLLCPNCHSQQDTNKGGINNRKETKRNKYLRKYKSMS